MELCDGRETVLAEQNRNSNNSLQLFRTCSNYMHFCVEFCYGAQFDALSALGPELY